MKKEVILKKEKITWIKEEKEKVMRRGEQRQSNVEEKKCGEEGRKNDIRE